MANKPHSELSSSSLVPSLGSLGPAQSTIDITAASKALAGLMPQPSKTVPSTSQHQTDSKKRGPNSHRVRNMFDAITDQRIPLDTLINQHNVSVHVARQGKRFDPFSDRGTVVIKTLSDGNSGKRTYIWRMSPNDKM